MEVQHFGDVAVIAPKGAIRAGNRVEALSDAIQQAHTETKKLVIDFGGVGDLNTAALTELVKAYTLYKGSGGEVKLCALKDSMDRLLEMVKLSMFEHYSTRAEAIASFAAATEA